MSALIIQKKGDLYWPDSGSNSRPAEMGQRAQTSDALDQI
jgi:hypothetical protein